MKFILVNVVGITVVVFFDVIMATEITEAIIPARRKPIKRNKSVQGREHEQNLFL